MNDPALEQLTYWRFQYPQIAPALDELLAARARIAELEADNAHLLAQRDDLLSRVAELKRAVEGLG